jgi:hypothetical protein
VIPIYIESVPDDALPNGLRLKHGIVLGAACNMEDAAAKLVTWLQNGPSFLPLHASTPQSVGVGRLSHRIFQKRHVGTSVVLGLLFAVGAGAVTSWRNADDGSNPPRVLVPRMVKNAFIYPRGKSISAAIIVGRNPYSITLNPAAFPDVGFAGACWDLQRSQNVEHADHLEFWVRTDTPGKFEFKAERLDGRDSHRPITLAIPKDAWSAARVPIASIEPSVRAALGRLCVGTDARTHSGVATVDVGRVELY